MNSCWESLNPDLYLFCIELCRYVGLKNSYKIRRNAKTCWKDSSAEMWNIIMLENIGVKNTQKGTITIDIFLLMNLAQFFGARVCWCLLAGKKASWESRDNSPRLELEPTCVAGKSQRQRGDELCWAETPGLWAGVALLAGAGGAARVALALLARCLWPCPLSPG